MCVTIWIIVIIIFLLYITGNSYEHYTGTPSGTPTYTVPHLILYVVDPVGETKYNYYMRSKLTHIMDHWTGFVQYAKRYMPYLKISKINYATNKINKYSELLPHGEVAEQADIPTVVLHNKLNRMIIYHGDITIHNLIRFVNNHS